MAPGLRGELTHRGNLHSTRYGWLRLTPAHSVHLITELLDAHAGPDSVVLDPFCGSGTTALACAERGIRSESCDINPFLLWLAHAKTRQYTARHILRFREVAVEIGGALVSPPASAWVPPIYRIDRWWDAPTLAALAGAWHRIRCVETCESAETVDLLKVAFGRLLIGAAQVSFGHQSMSFRRAKGEQRKAGGRRSVEPAGCEPHDAGESGRLKSRLRTARGVPSDTGDMWEGIQSTEVDFVPLASAVSTAGQPPGQRDHSSATSPDLVPIVGAVSTAGQPLGTAYPSAQAPAPSRIPLSSLWEDIAESIAVSAASPVVTVPGFVRCDARILPMAERRYTCVITSPPYPNRMSYIRELRPYMYWLGYLADGREAGEMDWQAIGGTWGCATSRLGSWRARNPVGPGRLASAVTEVRDRSPVLASYLERYFEDMATHLAALHRVVAPGGSIHYIVGNTRFYDTLIPVQELLAELMEGVGFREPSVSVIRKRTSKRELYEYVVSARRPWEFWRYEIPSRDR